MQRACLSTTASAAAAAVKAPRVIFSGIQPTGVPHLGNYAGALRQWVTLQRKEPRSTRLIYSVVDLHAITTPQDPDRLRSWRRQTLAALLAVGVNPERATLFFQSAVPAHSELMWILSCTASVGYLSRMTQWKSVASKLKLGLFSYPVLQAADILVHRATHVPVGHDQKQHLEFARECVTNFNHAYGPHLVHPQTIIPTVHRVMSLTEPTSKMSKSHEQARSRILITDTPEEIKTKVGSALTDSISGLSYDLSNRPGISNLLSIWSLFDSQSRNAEQLAEQHNDVSHRQLKELVSDAVISGLDGVRDRYLQILSAQDGYLDHVEADGARKAQASAQETMDIVKEAMGMSSFSKVA